VAVDAWDVKPGLPKALVPIQSNLEHLMRKQYVYGYIHEVHDEWRFDNRHA